MNISMYDIILLALQVWYLVQASFNMSVNFIMQDFFLLKKDLVDFFDCQESNWQDKQASKQ